MCRDLWNWFCGGLGWWCRVGATVAADGAFFVVIRGGRVTFVEGEALLY
jgi:hypothetical protein